jgi:3-oxoacyl-[acyl-carrier-protein] synthase-1
LNPDQTFSAAFRQPHIHNPHAPGTFIAHRTGISGPVMTISTACSSSAKVFAAGARWLAAGLVDAVLAGGVDSLCLSVLHGFHALQLISTQPCRPFDRTRDGINIGEGAGFALLVRAADAPADSVRFAGYGESSDAYHMSHPHPQGAGAILAMREALQRARLDAVAIGYINLHGTASRINDLVEARALQALFSRHTRVSSTKGWTGHTLGAAGIIEALLAVEALRSGTLPGTLHLSEPDPEIEFPVLQDNEPADIQHVMSNSFGFGGNNCCLIFSRAGT